jgi:hypothetical protein
VRFDRAALGGFGLNLRAWNARAFAALNRASGARLGYLVRGKDLTITRSLIQPSYSTSR